MIINSLFNSFALPVVQKPAQVICISSGKSGAGNSTLAVNLGITLGHAGKKVCLLDADNRQTTINRFLGITPKSTLEHFFKDELTLEEIMIKGQGNIDIIAGVSGIADFEQLPYLQQSRLLHGLQRLEQLYQYVLIDTVAGIDGTYIHLILAAPYLLLTITAEPDSLTDAFSLLWRLKNNNFQGAVLVLVNRVANPLYAQETFKRFKSSVNKYLNLQVYFCGYIFFDTNVSNAILHQQAIVLKQPESPASQCIFSISKQLHLFLTKKKALELNFSLYFSDLMKPDPKLNSKTHDPEEEFQVTGIEKGTIWPQNSTSINTFDETEKLLRASYYARLLGEKMNDIN